jgi:uracil phosphoribosyltransferase
MEQGLRDCCRSIRLGKILIQSDEDTHIAKSVYAKVPHDVCRRKVLLMYPIMSKCVSFFFSMRISGEGVHIRKG